MNDPTSLQIFLSTNGTATGFLYLDDGQSFDYRSKNAYVLGKFDLAKRTLTYQFERGDQEASKSWLERVTIYGYPSKPNRVQSQLGAENGQQVQLAFKYDPNTHILVIRKPSLPFGQDWQIKIL